MNRREAAVECVSLTHVYPDIDGADLTALDSVDMCIRAGEAVALVGPSGAGKSTLLTLLAGLTRPTSGQVRVVGQDVTAMSEGALRRLRARRLGVVLQTPARNVLPYATARENVQFAQRFTDTGRAERRAEAVELLLTVGLGDRVDDPAGRLSGGEQQRLAVAVALAGRPAVLLADEPTSQLDRETGAGVVDLLLSARERRGTTLVVVTHDRHVSDALDVAYGIHEGRLERIQPTTDGAPS